MSDSKNGFGYEIVDDIPTTASKYLSFRKGDKGKTIQIRLVSEPRYILQHWIMGDNGKQTPVNCIGEKCPYCGKDVPPKEKLPKIDVEPSVSKSSSTISFSITWIFIRGNS